MAQWGRSEAVIVPKIAAASCPPCQVTCAFMPIWVMYVLSAVSGAKSSFCSGVSASLMGTKSQSAIEISAILHTVHSFVGEKFWTNLWEKEEKRGKVVRGWDEIRESVLEVCQRHIWEIFVPFLLLRHHLLIISSAVKVSSFVTAYFFSDARMGAVSLDERHRARIERMMMEEEEAKELEVEVSIIHLWFLTLSACRPIWPQQVTGAQWRAQCTCLLSVALPLVLWFHICHHLPVLVIICYCSASSSSMV